MELTYAGRVFLNYALHQQKALIAMRHEFSDITNNQKGELRIGLAYSRSQSLMPNMITHFQKKWPNIQIVLHENYDLTKKLLDGDLDLAISNIHTSSPDIEYVPFYEEHTILIVSKAMLKQLSVDANLLQEQLLSGHLELCIRNVGACFASERIPLPDLFQLFKADLSVEYDIGIHSGW